MMNGQEWWRPLDEIRAEIAVEVKRNLKVNDMVARIREGYRQLGVDDPTCDMVAEAMNRPAGAGRAWDVVADLTGHRQPSDETKRLVLEQFPQPDCETPGCDRQSEGVLRGNRLCGSCADRLAACLG